MFRWVVFVQTWTLSKNLHRRIFRPKILHRQLQLISTVLVTKTQKNEWTRRNLHRWQKFYTAAGSNGIDKFHLCLEADKMRGNVEESLMTTFNEPQPIVHCIVHRVLSAILYLVSFHFFIYEYCLVIDYVEPFWSVMHRRRDKAAIPSHIGKHKQLYPTWSTLSNCKL